ncbi:MAG: hypothetical protein ACT4OG_00385 [Alphaproteobacteria bacterium]
MLARAASFFLASACLVLAGCKTDGVATATPSAAGSGGHMALLSPPTVGRGLVGWEADKIRGLYGVPAFVRREKKSELWRYDGQDCAAIFILYQDAETLRVRHVETYPQKGAVADAACLAGIKRRAPATS